MIQACAQTIVMPRLVVFKLQATNNEIPLCKSVVINTFASPAILHRHVGLQPAEYAQTVHEHCAFRTPKYLNLLNCLHLYTRLNMHENLQ